MRLLLVNPATLPSFWGFEYAMDLLGGKYSNAPLGCITIAALTPPDWSVTLVDENVTPVDLDADCDVVGIAAMNVQAARAFALADGFRRRGRTVVLGGPFPTLEPERCQAHADVVFVGEAENTWPKFCRDFQRGAHLARYQDPGVVDLLKSPVPRYDLLRADAYAALPIQTSRGCPFNCEFCDIIVMHGRQVRTKTAEQVVAAMDAISRTGKQAVFFTDDNFVGAPKHARAILAAVAQYRRESGFAPLVYTQASVNLADHPDILAAMADTGFSRVFLGIESPRQASVREAGKGQNLKGDLLERIYTIQRAGLVTWAGMIVGFDHDDPSIFAEQAEFLEQAGIAVAMVGMLNAPPRTPLFARLSREGRIDAHADWADNCAWTNIVPKQMTRAELFAGYAELVTHLYQPERYVARLRSNLDRMSQAARAHSARLPSLGDLADLWRAVRRFTLSRDPEKRRVFVPNLVRIMARTPRQTVEGAIHLGLWRHFEQYVRELAAKLDEAVTLERLRSREREVSLQRVGLAGQPKSDPASIELPWQAALVPGLSRIGSTP